MSDLKPNHAELAEKLARHGLQLPESDLDALAPMIAEVEESSRALRRARPFALEPACTLDIYRVLEATP